jgi:ubiquinone/menaquinone biosynthesis C-methylase UbiE
LNCDRIARWYRWLEYAAFGSALQRRREAFLPDVSKASRVLVLGDGDGRGLRALLNAAPGACIDYVDLSARMLRLARARVGSVHVTFHHANALDFVSQQAKARHSFDLVVTHFFLDCLQGEQMEQFLSDVDRITHRGTRWVVSEFRDESTWSRTLIQVLYSFFRLSTGLQTRRLVDHHPYFLRAGFQPLKSERALGGLLISELWAKQAGRAGSDARAVRLDNTATHAESGEPPGKALIGG